MITRSTSRHSRHWPTFAQVVYLDHRGNGRSSGDDPKTWNLAQWGDDVKGFCDALGIEKPIVYGASFGGMVTLAYATRHPMHPGKLILVSTEAAGTSHPERRVALFERLGGPEVGALARRRFLEGKLDAADMEAWERLAFPVYTRRPKDPLAAQRGVRRREVNLWSARPDGEGRTFNFFPELSRIQCPTLVLGGEDDPMVPIECQEDIVAALPSHLVRFERFPKRGHSVITDAPDHAFTVIRDFIGSKAANVAAGSCAAALQTRRRRSESLAAARSRRLAKYAGLSARRSNGETRSACSGAPSMIKPGRFRAPDMTRQ